MESDNSQSDLIVCPQAPVVVVPSVVASDCLSLDSLFAIMARAFGAGPKSSGPRISLLHFLDHPYLDYIFFF